MSSLSRELVFLILQFLDEEKLQGDSPQVGTRVWILLQYDIFRRSSSSRRMERRVCLFHEDLFKEITQLLTLENFRQNEQLSKYGDTKSARNVMLVELKKLIEANPLFCDKLAFPAFKASRLRTLINQSLNWQHQLCKNPQPNPDIKTLFTDHTCSSSNGACAPPPSNSFLDGPAPKPGTFLPLEAHGPFQRVVSPSPSAIAGWMSSANHSVLHPAVVAGPPAIVRAPGAATFLKHLRTPPGASAMDYETSDSEHLMKRLRVSFSGSTHSPNIYSPHDLPKTVARNLSQGSNVMSFGLPSSATDCSSSWNKCW
ncbi:unnamed protein product [Coffea canephora]|uniref:Uncharacterized protein n=1 Tax=Coffea canephora TaxID=49390 RepID=A0A068UTA6_COFCA|nr:unnamed protein product [Coffea canephora]